MVMLNEVLGDGQPKTAPTFPARDQGIEHPLTDVLGNPRPVVNHLDLHGQAIPLLGQRHLPQRTCSQDDTAFTRHRLSRIARNIENRLNQLLPVTHQLRQAGVVISRYLQGPGILCGQQAAHPFENLVDIHRRRQHRPMWR